MWYKARKVGSGNIKCLSDTFHSKMLLVTRVLEMNRNDPWPHRPYN